VRWTIGNPIRQSRHAIARSRNLAIPQSHNPAIPIEDQKSAMREIPILNRSILNPQ